MADLLLAVAKGLAGVPGLAPIFNPLVALREEEKVDQANAILMKKISEGHEVSHEALDDLLVGLLGIRVDNQAIRQQMIGGFHAIIKLILHQQNQTKIPERTNQSLTSMLNLEKEIFVLIQENKSNLAAAGLVTLEALRDELVRLFSDDVRTLLSIAQPAGFPKGWVPTTVTPIQAYSDFLEVCEGLENPQKAQIAQALVRKKPGSTLLRTWSAMYSS